MVTRSKTHAGLRSFLGLGVLCFALLFTAAASAQTQITSTQFSNAAAQALSDGKLPEALGLAQAALRTDPTDVQALLVQSAAARASGFFDLAIASARKAWRQAETPPARFTAARLAAQALSSSGAKTRAQLWLRRAGQVAPTPELKALARREFQFVQKQNPWAVSFNFGVAPNSNINNGSREDTLLVGGQPFILSADALALSGIEYKAGVNLRYRLEESPTRRRDLTLRVTTETYTLSSDSKESAPDTEGSDFATSSVVFSFAQRQRATNGNGEVSFGADLGFVWYGGDPLDRYLRLSAARILRVGQASKATFRFSTTLNAGSTQIAPSELYAAGAEYQRQVGRGNILTLSLGLNKLDSENQNSDFTSWQTGAAYQFGRPILGTALSFSLALEARDYPVSGFTTDGRQDFSAVGKAHVVFQNFDYYGFAPTMTLTARNTTSNISRFETDALGLEVGFRSTF